MKTPLPDTLPSDTFCLAPLRGVTVRAFRALHARWFTPPDYAVAPFIGALISLALYREVPGALFWAALAVMALGTAFVNRG